MESILIHPKSKEQLEAIKALAVALKMEFELEPKSDDSPYNPEFVEKIKQGDSDMKEGKGTKMTLKELTG